MPSGSLRVRVYAGVDILTGVDLYLRQTVPAGRTARKETEALCAEFIKQVEEWRNPKTNASLLTLLTEHLKTAKVGKRTKEALEGHVGKHIEGRPIGARAIGEIGAQILETFYAELGRCRDHCDGRPFVRHYTDDEHRCTRRCRRHVCKPLADCEAALALARRHHNPTEEAAALQNLGEIAHRAGEYGKVLDYHHQALTLQHKQGNGHGEAETLGHLGLSCHALGQRDQARAAWRQALVIYRALHRAADVDQIRQQMETLNDEGSSAH